MAALIVLFNLKPGVTEADYEAFARDLDVPTVKGLKSVSDFRVFRMNGIMGTEDAAPYRYVEVIDFSSMDELGADIGASPAMAEITAKFGALADAVFMLGEAFA
jgi:REDY-like protein HapK